MPLPIQSGVEPIAGYRLVDRLGSGGYGQVWSARGPDGRLVAVKIVHGDLAVARDRTAEQELLALRRVLPIRHPFLLPVERYEVIDGRLIIITPLAEADLSKRFRDSRARGLPGIPRGDLLRYLADAAEALDALRAAHLQHLDIKPQNLFLVTDRCVVGDFGLTCDLRSARPGSGASPAYSAPETFAGTLSPHCDQYSLAVVYQELLTGAGPYAGTSAEQLADRHLTGAPNLAVLPANDRAVVGRALAKKPRDRFASCVDFIRALHEPAGHEIPTNDLRTERKSVVQGPRSAILPGLIIGIGGVGGAVLGRLRRRLSEQFGPRDSWPVRLLYVDTDPEAIRALVDSGVLEPPEVLPTRLQRADQYAKLRFEPTSSGSLPWFDPTWLKRLSAAQTPQGCRGLGRLAFADHVRALSQKIEADLAAITYLTPGRPRVMIVSGVAGGTGGGMAVDMAYLARCLLRPFGETSAVLGWLLLPPAGAADRATPNAFAALAELRHFSKPETTYRARCDDPPGFLTSRDAPFTETIILPSNDSGLAWAADGLLREVLSPTTGSVTEPGECRTFGQSRLSWPRQAIAHQAGRRLAEQLIQNWVHTDSSTVEAAVRAWLAERWTVIELGPEALAARVRQSATAALGRPVEEAFAAIAGPAQLARPDALPELFARFDSLLERLGLSLAPASDRLAREWGTRLSRPAATLIEQPGFRLAGAEAAVRWLSERIERAIAHTSTAADEAKRKADTARSAAADPMSAARLRFQAIVMHEMANIYGRLRRNLADQLAELALCRTRLVAVRDGLKKNEPGDTITAVLLLPAECQTITEAAAGISITTDDLSELDKRMQNQLLESVGGLARACLAGSDLPRTLGDGIVGLAETLLGSRIGDGGAAEAFLARNSDPACAFKRLWEEAAPAFSNGAVEVPAAIVPEHLAAIAQQSLGDDVTINGGSDEITVIRSIPRMPLTALPQLALAAQAAYRRRKAAGDSPHARMDVPFGD
jgi:serine/threonine protein kinase